LVNSAHDLAKNFAQTQMLMTRQLSNPFPPFVLVVVVFWAAALFFGNGLLATPNLLSVGAHLVGAIAIATAIFLILELSQPYSGVVRLSPLRRPTAAGSRTGRCDRGDTCASSGGGRSRPPIARGLQKMGTRERHGGRPTGYLKTGTRNRSQLAARMDRPPVSTTFVGCASASRSRRDL
jgi:hypothetical protein